MAEINENVKILGRRVLVKRERLDMGALKGTPAMEDGEKNRGVIIAVGRIGVFDKFRGIRIGTKIIFNKHFIPNLNEETENMAFVEVENILAIE